MKLQYNNIYFKFCYDTTSNNTNLCGARHDTLMKYHAWVRTSGTRNMTVNYRKVRNREVHEIREHDMIARSGKW